VSACNFCGRQNETGAHFCTDCGKPLTKAAAIGLADPPASSSKRKLPTCPFCGSPANPHLPFCAHCGRRLTAPGSGPTCSRCGSAVTAGTRFCAACGAPFTEAGGGEGAAAGSRLTADKRTDYALTLVLLNDTGQEVQRFARKHVATTIGRQEGDIRFPEDAFLSPLHTKISWEEDRLEVRDLGSRNGTWVFLESPYRLADGDLVLIGSQVIRFRRLGYPGPHAPDADATRRMGSLVPSADIASLTQLRSDGSSRDTIQLSPGRDVHIGRERGDWIFPYDPSMSAQHATVRSEDADFVLLDDHSRNGVAIAARGAMGLRHGSRIMAGDKLLRVELPS
jgi:pSer/pThr/pTyr-binding forkhead associated (FHA) protein/DNA-directed RNA polymerase subunit RPC12/RpoP